ncbi:thioredoxin reductase (NADPH) [Arthrobacter pascens]|uniref:NAD(P)/FAD-dependent oxidoreductase n=1 Tax=Arthrobacter pascens TaxID=1677 RepID=UPI00278259F5|nr:FAD-dependent oxidoreductase [Arthrobacter pascens]MDQ0634403.1 thioredoxin reductase (NADPH) [Arthrobacter pascens]
MNEAHNPAVVRVLGLPGSPEAFAIRDFLTRSGVSYAWEDVTFTDLSVSALLPIVEFPDGRRVTNAIVSAVAGALGWLSQPTLREYDLSIYGAGPAGLSAAVYAASEGLRVVVLERDAVGGQAGSSSLIENYLGFPQGIAGAQLAERARQQALNFGAEILIMREGIKGNFRDGLMYATLADGSTMVARSNVCATGVRWRRLGLVHEEELIGRGVYYGAGTSEAGNCIDTEVVVVGGGNSAGQAVMNLAAYATRVIMVVRGDSLAATLSSYLSDRIMAQPNVEVRLNTRVSHLHAQDGILAGVTLVDASGVPDIHSASRLFICIGGEPETEWAAGTPIIRDQLGYLVTGPDLQNKDLDGVWPLERPPFYLETSVPGSFAAGDVRHKSVKRVASAVGEGAMAVTFVHRFLAEAF